MHPAVRQYLKAVSRALIGDRKRRRRFLDTLRERITETGETPDDVTYASLCVRFGTPQEMAAAFLETEGPAQVKAAVDWKKKALLAVAIALAVALLGWALVLVSLHREGQKNLGGFTVDLLDESEVLIAEDDTT